MRSNQLSYLAVHFAGAKIEILLIAHNPFTDQFNFLHVMQSRLSK